ncbi:hypothetical protein CA850_28775 [Micromonospora echinospora]|nr:hypothetical protein CA850_28775 [Micromonospora echinospora]
MLGAGRATDPPSCLTGPGRRCRPDPDGEPARRRRAVSGARPDLGMRGGSALAAGGCRPGGGGLQGGRN